jgi:hypothetical protein
MSSTHPAGIYNTSFIYGELHSACNEGYRLYDDKTLYDDPELYISNQVEKHEEIYSSLVETKVVNII